MNTLQMPARLRAALTFFGGLILIGILTGCETVHNYSLQSYQGPLPMADQRMVELLK